jgi:ATP-dependent Clp protease adaptor protein ClpS
MAEEQPKEGPNQAGGTATAEPAPKPKEKARQKIKPKQLPPYHVILLDDNDHTYAYVIEMLKAVFAYPDEKGYQLAKEVDAKGRVIVMTTHKEKAELKRDQIHAFGADYRIASCKGSMTATIEPAEG